MGFDPLEERLGQFDRVDPALADFAAQIGRRHVEPGSAHVYPQNTQPNGSDRLQHGQWAMAGLAMQEWNMMPIS